MYKILFCDMQNLGRFLGSSEYTEPVGWQPPQNTVACHSEPQAGSNSEHADPDPGEWQSQGSNSEHSETVGWQPPQNTVACHSEPQAGSNSEHTDHDPGEWQLLGSNSELSETVGWQPPQNTVGCQPLLMAVQSEPVATVLSESVANIEDTDAVTCSNVCRIYRQRKCNSATN